MSSSHASDSPKLISWLLFHIYSTTCSRFTYLPPMHNAALSGEQRLPPNLNHCTFNTKLNLN
ncbi:hypothetical protein FRN28_21370 [Vibrio vulnificus]|nr:hypothetical protein [Vibrio vulnificus]